MPLTELNTNLELPKKRKLGKDDKENALQVYADKHETSFQATPIAVSQLRNQQHQPEPTMATEWYIELAKLHTSLTEARAELAGKDAQIAELKNGLKQAERRALELEESFRSKVIAQGSVEAELHAQYSVKHKAKVEALKEAYENQWRAKVVELEQLVEAEICARQEIENLWQEFIALESAQSTQSVELSQRTEESSTNMTDKLTISPAQSTPPSAFPASEFTNVADDAISVYFSPGSI
ncbi:hypothetical protein CANCADRAFT_42611 [Tortispora caseinolytica NRRL Y-17796]|uniref:Uncharacterized protein n=1 Tax=Tortispora caseinolytica NRRL Y-17796 TaxID=767744 RepID=A0A1E4TJN6_9ASCO|nr:hypothetical protein CANCADRAFT_42611 [Tortispora caseinolytica NRRL Y-17796]